MGNVYNFFGILREHTDISEKEILEISKKFKEGHTGAMLLNLDEKDYYLVYEKSRHSGLGISGTCPGRYRQCQYEHFAT